MTINNSLTINDKMTKSTNNKAFTLLEMLLVIAVIAILAGIVIVAINPARQLAQARNSQRASDISALAKAVKQYYVDIQKWPWGSTNPSLSMREICKTGGGNINCINLDSLVPDYMESLPKNPDGGNYIIALDNEQLSLGAPGSAENNLQPVYIGNNADVKNSVYRKSDTIISGICGSANGQTFSQSPDGNPNLCSAGTASGISLDGYFGDLKYTWRCLGSNGGSDSNFCNAIRVNPKTFYSDGGSIKCSSVKSGDTGVVDGITYTAVDNSSIIAMKNAGSDMTKICTSLVTDMSRLFQYTEFNQNISNWDVSNVTNMRLMFFNSTFNQDISNWNTGKVTDMSDMFRGARQFNQNISNWDVSNVRNMSGMFEYTYHITLDISNWNTGKVTNMSRMFKDSFFYKDISNWNVSNVTDMSEMFSNGVYATSLNPFNQDISNWNVSNVTNMDSMFRNSGFNQDISMWCVEQIPTKPLGFDISFGVYNMEPNKQPRWGQPCI